EQEVSGLKVQFRGREALILARLAGAVHLLFYQSKRLKTQAVAELSVWARRAVPQVLQLGVLKACRLELQAFPEAQFAWRLRAELRGLRIMHWEQRRVPEV